MCFWAYLGKEYFITEFIVGPEFHVRVLTKYLSGCVCVGNLSSLTQHARPYLSHLFSSAWGYVPASLPILQNPHGSRLSTFCLFYLESPHPCSFHFLQLSNFYSCFQHPAEAWPHLWTQTHLLVTTSEIVSTMMFSTL